MRSYAILALVFLTACGLSESSIKSPETVHPFEGCWQSKDGLAIESWTADPSGWLFGYAVNRDKDNTVKFFEQMRFDGETLTVIGPNDDPTQFIQVKSESGYIFENPDHDYPQRISYWPSVGNLDADISMLDGSRKVEFKKFRCL